MMRSENGKENYSMPFATPLSPSSTSYSSGSEGKEKTTNSVSASSSVTPQKLSRESRLHIFLGQVEHLSRHSSKSHTHKEENE
jgi:hypothetical protein